MIRRLLTLAAVGMFVCVSAGLAIMTHRPPPPRKALLEARARVNKLSTGSRSSSLRNAARELTAATFDELWINPSEIDAPSYGTNVLAHSARAVADLQRVLPSSKPAIELILGADRRLAQVVIAQARSGNEQHLGAATHELKVGNSDAAAGQSLAAVRAYWRAWQSAFQALTLLVAAKTTGMPTHDLSAAAENALGSKKIALAGPRFLQGKPALRRDGKPELFFAGSEACPYCGIERWGMIVALSQFGTFSNLHLMQSDAREQPSDRTFTFYRSRYRSRYVSFVPVEVLSNVRDGYKLRPLQRLTKAQDALLRKYDPPEQTPLIDVAGRFVRVGSTALPPLITRLSWTQIADSLTHPHTISAQAIGGTAEVLTAELCVVTKGKPKSVCSTQVVHDYTVALPLLDGRGGGCPLTAGDTAAPIAQPSLRGSLTARAAPRVRPASCHRG